MIKRNVFIFLIAFTLSFSMAAQEKWSLERCIDYALENNLQIKLQELNTRVSQNVLLQSKANVLPSLNAGSSQSYTFGRSIDIFTNLPVDDNNQSFSYQITSQFNIFNGFQTINTIRQNSLNLQASMKDLEKMQNDISLNIASAYLQILFAIEQLANAENQAESSKLQVERTKALVDAGSLPLGNLLEIQSQLAVEELRVVNARNILSMSYLTLTQFLELPSTENFEIEIPDFTEFSIESLTYNVGEIYDTAVEIQPQITSGELNLQSAMKGLSIAKGRRSPRLTLSGSYGSGYRRLIRDGQVLDIPGVPSEFWEQIENNQSRSISVGLSIPIFNAYQISTGVKNARINVLNYDYQLQLRKNSLYRDIQQAYADAVSAFENFQASTKAVAASEESFRYTEQRFNVGLVTSVDYNTAKNQLARIQSDLLSSKYEYIFKINILEFYLGNQISL
jgi:outer membrane protein